MVIFRCYFLKHQRDLISIVTVSAMAVANLLAAKESGEFPSTLSARAPGVEDLDLSDVAVTGCVELLIGPVLFRA